MHTLRSPPFSSAYAPFIAGDIIKILSGRRSPADRLGATEAQSFAKFILEVDEC